MLKPVVSWLNNHAKGGELDFYSPPFINFIIMLKLNQIVWGQEKKIRAREETIIFPYRKYFHPELPAHQQMWSMSGQCGRNGEKDLNCELDQLLKSRLFQRNQYHGVEINQEICQANKLAWPELAWHHDEFYRCMSAAAHDEVYFPGIVNADLIQTVQTGAALIGNIMALLTATAKEEVMLITNFVMRCRRGTLKSGDDIVRKLKKCASFEYACNHGAWQLVPECYTYAGTNTGLRTGMGSLIFLLNARSILQ